MLNEVREVGITQATIEALHQLRHEWHETSYLLEASCMLVADKTSRSYAAGIWTDRVSTGCIDSARIGRILGSHQRTGWGPLKRLTDLIQQQMINVSPLHILELCDWMGRNPFLGNPFGRCRKVEFNASVNYNARYTDMMLYTVPDEVTGVAA